MNSVDIILSVHISRVLFAHSVLAFPMCSFASHILGFPYASFNLFQIASIVLHSTNKHK